MNSSFEFVDTLRLPPVKRFVASKWEEYCGSDFYGALHVAARYIGLKAPPGQFFGVWQHGCVPPWQQVQPEMCIYCAPKNWPCWVAREDEVDYLRKGGYQDVRAVGLPIVYTEATGVSRTPNSLLIMPMHAIPGDIYSRDSDQYLSELCKFRNYFDVIVACISGRCMDSGLWTKYFEWAGIPVVRGASIDDLNSLQRMRTLFESFDFVTTNAFGSHVPYALNFGARVSIFGWSEPYTTSYLLRDALWARYPSAAERFTSAATLSQRNDKIGHLFREPHTGLQDHSLGFELIGGQNKLEPKELMKAFNWTAQKGLRHGVRAIFKKALGRVD